MRTRRHNRVRRGVIVGTAFWAAWLMAEQGYARTPSNNYNIPSEPLADALKAFGEASSAEVLFDPALVKNRKGRAITGHYTDHDALKLLLAGSGLTYTVTPAGVILVVAAPVVALEKPHFHHTPPQPEPAPTMVIVTGLRQSLRSAEDRKLHAVPIVDSLVSEDIGKFPDNNASEALARIAGVQVERAGGEANTVLVRGLPDVVTTVNDREIFTTSGRRAVIQDFTADSLAGLDVYKTNTADMLDGGIAGLINLRLRRPFDFKTSTLAAGFRVNQTTQAGKVDPIMSLLVSKRWNTGAGEIGVLINLSDSRAHFFDAVRFNGNLTAVAATQTVSPGDAGRGFLYPYMVGITYNRGARERPSANGSVQWRPDANTKLYADWLYQGYRNRGDADFFNSFLSNAPVLSDVVLSDDGHYAKSLTAPLASRNGPSKITQIAATDTTQVATGGVWTEGAWRLSAELAHTYSRYDESDVSIDTAFARQPTVQVIDFNRKGGVDYRLLGVDLGDPASYVFSNMFDSWSGSRGRSDQFRVDARYRSDWAVIHRFDFGIRYVSRLSSAYLGERRSDPLTEIQPLALLPGFNQAARVQPGFASSGIQQMRTWYGLSWNSIRDNLPALRALAFGDDAPEKPDLDPVSAFRAHETIGTAYIQASYTFTLFDKPVDGVAGLRIARTRNTLYGTSSDADGLLTPSIGQQKYSDVLPSLNGRFHFSDEVQLRFSAGKVVTRPAFNALNPAIRLDNPGTGFEVDGEGGNPKLHPIRASNYDLSLDYNFSRTGALSAAVFYRDINGFLTNFTTDEFYKGTPVRVTRPYSAGTGYLQGMELSYTSFFDFLPGVWRGFGLQANATYIDGVEQLPTLPGLAGGKGVLPGVSRYSYNMVGMYENNRVSARLAYNNRSPWITNYTSRGAVAREYTAAVSRLDLSVGFAASRHVTLTLDATNLLGSPFQDYFGTPATPRDVRYEDRTVSMGLRYRY